MQQEPYGLYGLEAVVNARCSYPLVQGLVLDDFCGTQLSDIC